MRTAIKLSTFCASVCKDSRSCRNRNNVQTSREICYKVHLDFTKSEDRNQTISKCRGWPLQTKAGKAHHYFLRKQKFLNSAAYFLQSKLHTLQEDCLLDPFNLFADAAHANESTKHESSVNKLHVRLFCGALITGMGIREHLALWFTVFYSILSFRACF